MQSFRVYCRCPCMQSFSGKYQSFSGMYHIGFQWNVSCSFSRMCYVKFKNIFLYSFCIVCYIEFQWNVLVFLHRVLAECVMQSFRVCCKISVQCYVEFQRKVSHSVSVESHIAFHQNSTQNFNRMSCIYIECHSFSRISQSFSKMCHAEQNFTQFQ